MTKPYSKHVFCMWRIDGEFMFTQIPVAACPPRDASSDEWVKAAIRAEHESHAFDESEILELIAMATDDDFPDFCGYEIVTVFETEEMPRFII